MEDPLFSRLFSKILQQIHDEEESKIIAEANSDQEWDSEEEIPDEELEKLTSEVEEMLSSYDADFDTSDASQAAPQNNDSVNCKPKKIQCPQTAIIWNQTEILPDPLQETSRKIVENDKITMEIFVLDCSFADKETCADIIVTKNSKLSTNNFCKSQKNELKLFEIGQMKYSVFFQLFLFKFSEVNLFKSVIFFLLLYDRSLLCIVLSNNLY